VIQLRVATRGRAKRLAGQADLKGHPHVTSPRILRSSSANPEAAVVVVLGIHLEPRPRLGHLDPSGSVISSRQGGGSRAPDPAAQLIAVARAERSAVSIHNDGRGGDVDADLDPRWSRPESDLMAAINCAITRVLFGRLSFWPARRPTRFVRPFLAGSRSDGGSGQVRGPRFGFPRPEGRSSRQLPADKRGRRRSLSLEAAVGRGGYRSDDGRRGFSRNSEIPMSPTNRSQPR